MFILQEGRCCICGNAETRLNADGTPRHLCVDHDHKTTRIRGLLYNCCNIVVGALDNIKESRYPVSQYVERLLAYVGKSRDA
jgi:hypothetical protein